MGTGQNWKRNSTKKVQFKHLDLLQDYNIIKLKLNFRRSITVCKTLDSVSILSIEIIKGMANVDTNTLF
jgi:hypothetical protein